MRQMMLVLSALVSCGTPTYAEEKTPQGVRASRDADAVQAAAGKASQLKTLTPEEAEKLICRDTALREVSVMRHFTVYKCRQEQRTKILDVDGVRKEMAYTVMVNVPEVIERPEKLMCKGDLLDLSGLEQMSVATARVLSHHHGVLMLNGLGELSADAAAALSEGSLQRLDVHGIETLSHETAEALLHFRGEVALTGLKRLDVCAFETLRLQRRLFPHALVIEGVNQPVVTWGSREPRPLSSCIKSLSTQIGRPVEVDPDVLRKYGIARGTMIAAPPLTVMSQDRAVAWLASQMSIDHPGAIVGNLDDDTLRFQQAPTKTR